MTGCVKYDKHLACQIGKLGSLPFLSCGNTTVRDVSRLLGHESLDTLKHYVKLHICPA